VPSYYAHCPETIVEQGYYAVAKQLVDYIVPSLRAENKTIYITGHSLGGTIAALISNLLKKVVL
jgi:putative lipase involved disintegration of autophagic bodies